MREQKVGGRERVDRERVERALSGAGVLVRRAVNSFSTAPARASSQTCGMSRAHVQWGVSYVCFRPLRECRVLARHTYFTA